MCARTAVRGYGLRCAARSAQLPLARSLALQYNTFRGRHTGSCSPLVRSLALHLAPLARPLSSACSLARSPLVRSLSDCHTPTHWYHCASRSVCCVPLARSLATRSIARSLLARLLVLCSLARSLAVAQPHTDTLVSPQRALQRGHPQQTATAMSMLLSRPPWWVCGGDKDARHLPIFASSINRK